MPSDNTQATPTFDQILSDALRIYASGIGRWTTLGALLILPPLVVMYFLDIDDEALGGMVLTLATLPGYALIVVDIWREWHGKSSTIQEACFAVEGPVLVQAILLGLMVGGGVWLLGSGLGILGVALVLGWLLIAFVGDQAVLIEGLGARDALYRSWALVKPAWGVCLTILVLVFMMQIAVGGVSSYVEEEGWIDGLPLVRWALYMVLFPFLAVLQTVVYYDLRILEGNKPEELIKTTGDEER